ncbi:MAG TPA: hypothetical protein VFZ21_09870 [Gemmatimonadaceae bacterium]|jgi:hypothetical protein|nr:hypothetical protein [Gemmatimonadaceae bacterium]
MKPNALLTITSLLSILLMSLHITDDIVRGISPARADNIGAVVIFAAVRAFWVHQRSTPR